MSDSKETSAFLANVPLFRGLKKRQLQRLSKQFVSRDYDAGQAIVTQDKGGEGFFIITAGSAEAIREQTDGTKTLVNTFGPTDFFGELALLDDGLRTASVVATDQTQCLALTRWDFVAVLKEDADMAIVILEELAKRFRMALDVL
jgi:CRP-like cAMP-binding protein